MVTSSVLQKTKVIRNLETILNDIESQVNSLRQTNDVDWDCYDLNHWEWMIPDIKEAIKFIKGIKS